MEKSQTIGELAKALSKAQGEFKNVLKGSTAKITTKKGGEYSYQYADLAAVLESCMPIVSKHGLSICQGSTSEVKIVPNDVSPINKQGFTKITTILMHNSGEWIQNECSLPYVENGNNDIQAIGSGIMYGRRYEVCAILGIASQKDTDGTLQEKSKTPKLTSEKTKSMREYVMETAKLKFNNSDEFKIWRIDNDLPESLDGLFEIDLAKIWNELKKVKK